MYNRDALNRIAAEDRMDKLIVLVSPFVWVSIIGAFVMITALLIWGCFGHLPTSVDTKGIYMNRDGTVSVYSQREGFILNFAVDEGDMVKEGDLIATLGTEDEMFELKQLDKRIGYVENMTFESELDSVTLDTQEMAQIKLNAKQADSDQEKTKTELDLKKEKLKALANDVNSAETRMLEQKEKFYNTLNLSDERHNLAYQEANTDYDTHFNLYEQAKSTYISAKESYYALRDNFDAKYADIDTTDLDDAGNAAYEAAFADVESARSKADDYEYFMKEEENKLRVANETLEKVRKEYLEFLNEQSGTQAQNTIASTEYTEALNEYNNAKNLYKSLSDEVDELELQSILGEGDAKVNVEQFRKQFENKKSAVLSDLQVQRESVLNKAGKGEILATASGMVYDIPLEIGEGVSTGQIVIWMKTGDLISKDTVCYVNLADAKKIEPGMTAYAYPSTVNKQEYGHILARVEEVSDHVASTDDILMQLGSDALVKEFESEGPVVEVRCKLLEDPKTKSGYAWSTHKGSEIHLSEGTIFAVTVVTEEKKPIDLLIPYLKDKMEFNVDDQENG